MRKAALILAVVMIVCCAGAVSADDNMQRVLQSVKDRVDIPEKCTDFRSDIYNYDGASTYDFSWSYNEGNEYESFGVDADADGTITSISHYRYSYYDDYEGGKVIPKISKEEAISVADGLMAKFNPDIAGEYELSGASYSGENYFIQYGRFVNGIPTPDCAHVEIDGKSGELGWFSLSYTKYVRFPALDGVIGTDAAKDAFKDGALSMEYRTFGDDKTARIVYTDTDLYMINAFTGKKYEYGDETGAGYGYRNEADASYDMEAEKSVLTPEEIAVLDEIDSLLTEAELKEKLFAIPELGLGGAKVTNTSLIKDQNGNYYMNMSFAKEENYYWARVNAQTGQLVSFSGNWDSEGIEGADDFIEKYFSEYAKRSVSSGDGYRTRVENGIKYPQNYISAEKNSKSGYIQYFSLYFDEDVTFANPDGIISENEAYRILYDNVSPELEYIYEDKKAVPVYGLWFYDFSYIDAATGNLLDYSGEEATPYSKPEYTYTDISGHFAEDAINALGGVGVGFDGDVFKPDEVITQKDFAALVSQCIYDYVIYKGNGIDADETAKYCIDRGIIKKDEYYPDEPLTREKAVEILLRSMNYERFASIRGIFKVDFLDAESIDVDLFGYVAIASGLKLIQGTGGYFYPKENITRGQAAVIIYNYLNK